MGNEPPKNKVLVVGGGAVGMTGANLLMKLDVEAINTTSCEKFLLTLPKGNTAPPIEHLKDDRNPSKQPWFRRDSNGKLSRY